MARRLVVEIIGDASSLQRAFDRSAKSARKFNGEMSVTARTTRGLGQSLTGVLAGVGVAAGFQSAITAASDMNETLSKSDDVFGDNADAVKKWSKTLVESFGLSSRQALDTASSFGALFKPIGLVGDEAVRQSEKLTELGADLAAFYNTDVQDALDAVRSGIIGEAEPLRRYGVLLSETRVQQQAMAETGKKTAKSLTDQEKALARIHIILKDTKVAQGNFAETQKNAAEQAKIFKARLDDLKVEMGSGLLPIVNRTLDALNRLAEDLKGIRAQGPVRIVGPSSLILNKDILGMLSIKQAIQLAEDIDKMMARRRRNQRRNAALQRQGFSRAEDARIKGQAAISGGVTPADVQKAKRSAEQLNAFFDNMISRRLFRAGLAPLRQQLAQLRQVAVLITQRIAITRDITRKLNLEDQLLLVQAQQADVRQQLADQAAAAAEAAAAAREAAQAEARAWADFAIERAEVTDTLKDDLKAAQAKLKLLEKQAGVGKKTADQAREIWEAQQEVKRIRKEMAKDERGGTRFKPLNVKAFIASLGLDLSVTELRRLTVALSQLGPGGRMPGRPSAAFAGAGVVVNGDVHISGVQNTKQIEQELNKRTRRRAQHRRGG